MKNWCPGGGKRLGERELTPGEEKRKVLGEDHHMPGWYGGPIRNIRPKRIRCPECNRSFKVLPQTCHDGCCSTVIVPRHYKRTFQKKFTRKGK